MSMLINAQNAAKQDFMPLMRSLVRTYQAFTSFDAALHRGNGSGLTVSQADVIFTLGNSDGMTCGEIGEKTLITKGTLTGVIDRLVSKKLVSRNKGEDDGRCTRIVLTTEGQALFQTVFPQHLARIKERFDQLTAADKKRATELLNQIHRIF